MSIGVFDFSDMEEARLDEELVLKTSRSARVGLWVRILLLPQIVSGSAWSGRLPVTQDIRRVRIP